MSDQSFDETTERQDGSKVHRLESDILDAVYKEILSKLTLSQIHRDNLVSRGFSVAQIDEGNYKTLGLYGRREIATAIVNKFGAETCLRVPGLYQKNGIWNLAGSPGIVVPVRNPKKQITALKIRADIANNDKKYTYMSSAGDKGGLSAVSQAHVPLHAHTNLETVRLTEGELKADIATILGGVLTISIPGVSEWRKGIATLKALGVSCVKVSLDMDASINSAVAKALENIVEHLLAENLEVVIETWDSKYKGIDDALLAGTPITEHRGTEAEEVIKKFRESARQTSDDKKKTNSHSNPNPESSSTSESKESDNLGSDFPPKDVLDEIAIHGCGTTMALLSKAKLGEHMAHVERFRLAQIAIGAGLTDEQITALFERQANFDSTKTISYIKAMRNAFRLTSCKKVSEDLGLCSGTCRAKECAGTYSPNLILPKTNENGLPEIILNKRQSRFMYEDAWKAIHKANIPEVKVYRLDNALVRLSRPRKILEIEGMTDKMVLGHMARVANWMKDGRGGPYDCPPSKEVAGDLMANIDPSLPRLDQVIASPIFDVNGKLIDEPGYHPESAVYYDHLSTFKMPAIPKQPTPKDINRAKKWILKELLVDFPFASKADLANAIAALLLIPMRKLINGCTPLHGIEAPKQGTGKGYLADIIGLVATGVLMERQVLPFDDENELRKKITAELSRGRPHFLIDNLPNGGAFDSAVLAAAITAMEWADRWLGKSQIVHFPVNVLWMATGNNIVLSGDMPRRYIRIRVDANCDRPHLRSAFKHKNLHHFVNRYRPMLFWSVLTLIQAWIADGMPLFKDVTLGSFEDWARKIGGVLQVAEIPGFLSNLTEVYQKADVAGDEFRSFFVAWWEKFQDKEVLSDGLFQLCIQKNLMIEARGSDSALASVQSQKVKLGLKLKEQVGQVYGPYRLEPPRDGHQGRYYRLVIAAENPVGTPIKAAPAIVSGDGIKASESQPTPPQQSAELPRQNSLKVSEPCAKAPGVRGDTHTQLKDFDSRGLNLGGGAEVGVIQVPNGTPSVNANSDSPHSRRSDVSPVNLLPKSAGELSAELPPTVHLPLASKPAANAETMSQEDYDAI